MKTLALDWKGQISFAHIRKKNEGAVELFGIKKFPTLIFLPGGNAPGSIYKGKINQNSLGKWITEMRSKTATGNVPLKKTYHRISN